MEMAQAQAMARELMAQHGFGDLSLRITRASLVFGSCVFDTTGRAESIRLSSVLVGLNDEAKVRGVILHEIAHAIAGRHAGHGPQWQAVASRLGTEPRACGEWNSPAAPYELACEHCGKAYPRHRRQRATRSYYCGPCYRRGVRSVLMFRRAQ